MDQDSDKVSIFFNFPGRTATVELDIEKATQLLLDALGVGETMESQQPEKVPPIPETNELTEMVESNENYSFAVEDFVDYYLGGIQNVEKQEKARWINAVRSKLRRIRDRIEAEEGGTWVIDKKGLKKTYTFVKKQESTSDDMEAPTTHEQNTGSDQMEKWM